MQQEISENSNDEADKRGPYKKSEITRRKILDIAASLFRRHGYASTSVRDIAGRARMKSGSIYYYFDSKDKILDAVLQTGLIALHTSVRTAVEALPRGASSRDKLSAAVHAHLHAVLSKSDYIRANVSEFERAPKPIRERNLKLRKEYAAYWRQLFAEAQASGDVSSDVDLRLLRLFIIGAANWSTDWYKPGKQSVDEIAQRLFDYFYDGVAK